MITDNGIEYEYTEIKTFDEEHAFITATEYYDKGGNMVRRDVHAQLKELSTKGEIENG